MKETLDKDGEGEERGMSNGNGIGSLGLQSGSRMLGRF
jgi:hypothetical protein